MTKRFCDLSYSEMEKQLLAKEPSLDDLIRKGMLLLRSTIVSLGRIQTLMGIIEKPPPDFFKELYQHMSMVAGVTQRLPELIESQRKVTTNSVATGAANGK